MKPTRQTIETSPARKAFMQLHLSVLLAGFTGLFGYLVTADLVDVVW